MNCNTGLPIKNDSCTTTSTTTTTTPCPTYYLHQNPDTYCHYCTQASSGAIGGPYTGVPFGTIGCSDPCETARALADANEPRCQGCYQLIGSCEADTCWTCRACPEGESGSYTNLDDCNADAGYNNSQCSPICTTTTTTTSTTTSTTSTTTTTAAPTCVTVVEAVVCAPQSPGDGYVSGGGDIWTKSVSVVKCSTQPLPPAVFGSSFPNLEVKLLRAELKALTKKFVQLVDTLEKNNIKVL
jgi:hypothetical protein